MFVAAAFVSIMIHELGHAVLMRKFGASRVEIMLYAFGGQAAGNRWLGRWQSVAVSLAGPLVQIAVLLMARLPQTDQDTMLANWGRGVLDATPNVPMRLEFELSPSVFVLPAGTVLRVVVRNHWLRETPMPRNVVTAPYFESTTTSIRHGAGPEESFVDLPFRSTVRAGLVAPIFTMPVATPRNLQLQLRGGTTRAAATYLVLGGLSGQVPGLLLPGGVLPVNYDLLSELLLLSLGTPLVPGFVGVLDGNGRAQAACNLATLGALPPALAGLQMTFAAWVFDTVSGVDGAPTHPLDVALR
jgi:hypothetical protein